MEEKNRDLDLNTLRHKDVYQILHNDAGIIELAPPIGKFDSIWTANYRFNVTSGRTAEDALKELREHLKFGVRKIDEVLKNGGAKEAAKTAE